MLSLIENMTKHIIVERDSFYNECLVFLSQCECESPVYVFSTYVYANKQIFFAHNIISARIKL